MARGKMVRASKALAAAATWCLISVCSALVSTDRLREQPVLKLRPAVPASSALANSRGSLAAARETQGQGQGALLSRLKGGHGAPAAGAQGTGTTAELLICVSGIYFCYLYYGVLQEDLMTSKYGGKSFQEVCSLLFVVAMQCLIGAAFARVSCALSPQPPTGWQMWADFRGYQSTLWPVYIKLQVYVYMYACR